MEGPSGCGKSTLLSVVGLLDTASGGTYELNGRAVTELSAFERARTRNREIGFIFQSFNLIGDSSVFENVELPLTYRGMSATERRTRAFEALERVGMAHRAKHLPSQLSGGQQQRVAVARAVAGEPVLLLADEPTGNLDSRSGESVMELLHELYMHGSTICMVTHDPRYARHATRRIHLFRWTHGERRVCGVRQHVAHSGHRCFFKRRCSASIASRCRARLQAKNVQPTRESVRRCILVSYAAPRSHRTQGTR
ncbi:MAG: ABC transporter ATP-binding protein [Vicinamibacterales bacterium]